MQLPSITRPSIAGSTWHKLPLPKPTFKRKTKKRRKSNQESDFGVSCHKVALATEAEGTGLEPEETSHLSISEADTYEVGGNPCAALALYGTDSKRSHIWLATDMTMKLEIILPADLEAKVNKGAEAAGLDVPDYILQILRALDVDPCEPTISDDQFEQSLQRLRQIHSRAPSTFDDSRDSIYSLTAQLSVGRSSI